MKRALKGLGVLVLFLVVLVGAAALYIAAAPLPSYPLQKVDLKVEATPERVARGRLTAEIAYVRTLAQ